MEKISELVSPFRLTYRLDRALGKRTTKEKALTSQTILLVNSSPSKFMDNLSALTSALQTLVTKVEETSDSEGTPCTNPEATVIAAALIQLLTDHPQRSEYAQDLLDTARLTCDRSS